MKLYDITVPVFIRGLTILIKIVGKAKPKHLTGKLAPDMYNFIQQVQYAYFMALEAAEKLSGKKPPELAYDETSTTQLKKSLERVVAYLKTIKPVDIAKGEKKKVGSFLLNPKKKISARDYVLKLALPNFYFHCATAYDILRHKGVALKKDDYIGSV